MVNGTDRRKPKYRDKNPRAMLLSIPYMALQPLLGHALP